MPVDVQKYRKHLDGFDLTEAEKADLIHSLWTIMESFADRAFGLNTALPGAARDAWRESRGQTDGVDSEA